MSLEPDTANEESPGLTAFSSDHPIVLLTDFAPDQPGGGAVILRSLLTPGDRKRIVWATLSPIESRTDRSVVSLAPDGNRSLLRDGTVRIGALRKAALSVIKDRGAAAAWVVAHGAAVRVAPHLIAAGIPVHITVHDDPAWGNVILTRRYLALAPFFAYDLNRALRGARSVDVVSLPMAERYGARHGVSPVVVHRGLAESVSPAPEYTHESGLTVAVLGSTYGLREVGALAQALGLVGDRLRIQTRLLVIGTAKAARVRTLCPPGVDLEITGHLLEADGVKRLQGSFLLYLSYPFGRRGSVLRRTSFPTKLSSYVMAARPLLLHMPTDTSVAFLKATAPYATLWNSLNPEHGARAIVALWREARTANSFHDEAEHVRAQHFDLARNRAALFRELNALVEPSGDDAFM